MAVQSTPPPKPVMIFDGDCRFCALWIGRWQQATGDHVEYLPFQDPRVAERFPEIPREQFETAVQLVETNGRVYSAAEAVFRALAHNPRLAWPLWCYQKSPSLAALAEAGYRFVARRRPLFSALTRLGWGRHVEPPTHFLTRAVFLRSLAVIYFIAFVSLWTQISGLIGHNGIVPADKLMESARREVEQQQIGWERYHLLPTLCWFNAGDGALKFQCMAGAVLSVLLFLNAAPALCIFLLWLIYLSLTTVSGVFLGFQWDNLLLETGLLAIFLAPLQLWPKLSSERPPSRLALWLLRWLLFRLMFQSGCVKLLSDDPAWHDLTALTFHYETQPLPTWPGWFAHQLPLWTQKASCAGMFFIELAVPFLLFAPRRLRALGCWVTIAFQILIALTGNYCFFNLLTIALCVLWLDDAALQNFVPVKWSGFLCAHPARRVRRGWPVWFIAPVAAVLFLLSLVPLAGMFRVMRSLPMPLLAAYQWSGPFRSVNGYGLFMVMTKSRPEIIVEGSNDGVNWLAYEFKYKPGDLNRRPGFVAPHQPRLDWQMWFAALGDVRQNPWFVNCCVRLLQGPPEVLALLKHNPFPDHPPHSIRAVVYNYHFTDPATRRATGEWWRREFEREYLPAISLQPNAENP